MTICNTGNKHVTTGTLGSLYLVHVVHVGSHGSGTLQKGNCVKSCCMRCPQKAFNLLRHVQCQQCHVKRSEIDEVEPCETGISEHCCARYRNTLLPSRKEGPLDLARLHSQGLTVPSLQRTVMTFQFVQ